MAPPHTQAAPVKEKRQSLLTDMIRPGRVAKTTNHSLRSLRAAQLLEPADPQPVISKNEQAPTVPVLKENGLQSNQIRNIFRSIYESQGVKGEDYNDLDGPRTRKSYTREHKLAAITYATSTFIEDRDGKLTAIKLYRAAQHLYITQKMLKDWINKADVIAATRKGVRKNRKSSSGHEPVMEDRLATKFQEARAIRRSVGARWFLRHARRIYEDIHPERVSRLPGYIVPTYEGFKFSNGWFAGFKNRYHISLRRRTKLAQTAPVDLHDKIRSWLRFNRRNSQPLQRGSENRGVGRYRLSEISNMDQTPLAFEFMSDSTYNVKGADTVWIKVARSGWEKRQATLQILVHADGIKRCKPLLIFEGGIKSNARRDAEQRAYGKRVKVIWNPQAYANGDTMLEWIHTQYKGSTGEFLSANEPRLLSLDLFTGHKTEKVKQALKDMNTVMSIIPAGCTGYVQVLDVAVNKPLKDLIKEAADRHYDDNMAAWEAKSFNVGERRVLITQWVGWAWDELFIRHKEMIIQAFRKVGLSLNPDGSEDAEIDIKNHEFIEVGDWARPFPYGCDPYEHSNVEIVAAEMESDEETGDERSEDFEADSEADEA